MNKEEIDILYSFANDEDCRYVYDWQGFNYEEICPLIDKLIKENKELKEDINKYIRLGYKHLQEQNNKLEERIDKAIDKLYCWGEALNPEFQKIMLDILKEVK